MYSKGVRKGSKGEEEVKKEGRVEHSIAESIARGSEREVRVRRMQRKKEG